MSGVSGPQVTRGLHNTKGVEIRFKKPKPRRNPCLGLTFFLIGLLTMLFRYLWEASPDFRDTKLVGGVRTAASAMEMARQKAWDRLGTIGWALFPPLQA